ncbi:MAG: glycosyltransferase [Lachnospiraceae bacterium]|nr:glycosyltransferase [Lachnospiraceae bacterium]
MERKVLVSVIVPCYNAEKYIDRCVQSIIQQTIGLEQMQIILVDDASTDRTLEKICNWQLQYYETIQIMHNYKNRRQGTCRNMGMQQAVGKYIAFVDADDWIEPDMYERMIAIAEAGECDVVQCASSRDYEYYCYDSITQRQTGKQDRIIKITNREERGRLVASNLLGTYVVTKLYRKDFLEVSVIKFPEDLIYEDVYWMGLLNCYVKRIGFLEEKMYHYYINPVSVSQSRNALQHRDIIEVNRKLWEEYQTRGFFLTELKEALEYDMLCSYYLTALKMICLRFDTVPYEMFYEIQQDIRKMIPNHAANSYIAEYTKPFHILLLGLIDKTLKPDDIQIIAKGMRQLVKPFNYAYPKELNSYEAV